MQQGRFEAQAALHEGAGLIGGTESVKAAALDAFRVVQDELRLLERQYLDDADADRLWHQRWRLIWNTASALQLLPAARSDPRELAFALETNDRPWWPEAKRLQVEACGGRPLTVCYGHDGDGCGLVYADSPTARGRYPFRIYCETCRNRTRARKQAARARARALEAGLEQVIASDGSGRLMWSGECVDCGKTFEHTKPHVRHCRRHSN
jgi:hypothetical protein